MQPARVSPSVISRAVLGVQRINFQDAPADKAEVFYFFSSEAFPTGRWPTLFDETGAGCSDG
jgi:hypothetical protein